jgi:hypothetical protein
MSIRNCKSFDAPYSKAHRQSIGQRQKNLRRTKYSSCFSPHPQTQWITLCITSDSLEMIIANQPLMFT